MVAHICPYSGSERSFLLLKRRSSFLCFYTQAQYAGKCKDYKILCPLLLCGSKSWETETEKNNNLNLSALFEIDDQVGMHFIDLESICKIELNSLLSCYVFVPNVFIKITSKKANI